MLKYISACIGILLSMQSISDSGKQPESSSQPIASELPISYFSRLPLFSSPVLSPDGNWIAAEMVVNDEVKLVTFKLATPENPGTGMITPIDSGKFKFISHEWVNNERLMVRLRAIKDFPFTDKIYNIGKLATIKRDGTDVVDFRMGPNEYGLMNPNPRVISLLKDDPDHVIATIDLVKDSWDALPEVDKINVNTGKKKRIVRNTKEVKYWMADETGTVRLGVKYHGKSKKRKVKAYHRASSDDSWEVLFHGEAEDDDQLYPVRFKKDDNNILLVSSTQLREDNRNEGTKEKTLYEYDIKKRELGGIHVDSTRKKLIQMVSKAAPGKKVTIATQSEDKFKTIFRVQADNFPTTYYLFDLNTRKLDLIGSGYPDLMGAQLAKMKRVKYEARDGMKIPALLTLPATVKKKKNLPLIVFPHGGPRSHDKKGFNNYVQFFANRGYAVLQPQFRGSTGQGIKHERAGKGLWGQEMQDDITDGVNWLIETGKVDPKRVCIIGASYGGYAVTMGMAKTPDLYRCGISINGVQNLVELRSGLSKKHAEKIISKSVVKDYSPHHQADKITAPLLIIGSELDSVVPISHSQKLYKKMKKLKKDVEYVELDNGEHWRTNQPAEDQKFREIERFLTKHL